MQSSDQLLGSMMNSDRVCESGRRRTTPFGRSARTIVPEQTASATALAVSNAVHLARVLRGNNYPARV